MPAPLVECIPNFSDAQRPEVIEIIVEAITGIPGVHVLDLHSDLDHNRTVITFIGSPYDVEEAAFQAITKASELINLNEHIGEHPRIGATDVVPFVPISDISMQECVEIARRLGKRVAMNLNIPVYLYEEAATRPERHNLENIRRGQYEVLKKEISSNPNRVPDFGPCEVGTAGAIAIGARHPLIAFNVFLSTENVAIAKKIARSVRYSSGGLRFVKAIGILVNGLAQVSMNLTNYHETPIARVIEFIRRESSHYDTMIHHCELVGLIPLQALSDAATWYMQLDDFQTDKILELRLSEVLAIQLDKISKPTEFTNFNQLSRDTLPIGGTSAAAYVGAKAAALVAKVARLTTSKSKHKPTTHEFHILIKKAEDIKSELIRIANQDTSDFATLLTSKELLKITSEQQTARSDSVAQASYEAIKITFRVIINSTSVIKLALQTANICNQIYISEIGCAAIMARAAIKASIFNVRTSLTCVRDIELAKKLSDELHQMEKKALKLEQKIEKLIK